MRTETSKQSDSAGNFTAVAWHSVAHWQLWAGIIGAAACWLVFALKKSALGIDFTDEGLYLAAPLRLVQGERLFSSEIVTLTRPFELLTQGYFRLAHEPNLYGFRLCGWFLHIVSYLTFFFVLARTTGSVLIALGAASISFFFSFAWPTSIATPGYKSLSSDLLLLTICLLVWAEHLVGRRQRYAQVGAGLCLLVATVCYPPLVVLGALVLAYELRQALAAKKRGWKCLASCAATLTAVSGGLLLLFVLTADGSVARWLSRIALTKSFSLTSLQHQGGNFFVGLMVMLVTKVPLFTRYAWATAATAAVLLVGGRRIGVWARLMLAGFVGFSGYLFYACYNGDANTEHFFFPTAYCLVAFGSALVFTVHELRIAETRHSSLWLGLTLSLLATMIYCVATNFFDYYYSWNNGLLGLPFAFSVSLALIVARSVHSSRLALAVGSVLLAALTYQAARYNFVGVRRDAAVPQLTATFSIPPLAGVRSTPARVRPIEELYAYLKPKLASDNRLLAFDDCPMIYFILGAKPAYGLCWAARYSISPSTHEALVRDFLHAPLPEYAVRMIVDSSEADWTHAAKVDYGGDYLLGRAVAERYEVERVIFPFEVLRRKRP